LLENEKRVNTLRRDLFAGLMNARSCSHVIDGASAIFTSSRCFSHGIMLDDDTPAFAVRPASINGRAPSLRFCWQFLCIDKELYAINIATISLSLELSINNIIK
jgi:hypothetical protein